MKKYSRREWLRHVAGTAAVSATAPYVVPSSVLGAEGAGRTALSAWGGDAKLTK